MARGLISFLTALTTIWPQRNSWTLAPYRQDLFEGTVRFQGGMPPGLRQSQRVSVRLIFETRPNVLKVSRGPFLEGGGGRKAYVLADGLATLRPIRAGATSVSEVEIVDGLNEGDRILLSDMDQFNGAKTILVRR